MMDLVDKHIRRQPHQSSVILDAKLAPDLCELRRVNGPEVSRAPWSCFGRGPREKWSEHTRGWHFFSPPASWPSTGSRLAASHLGEFVAMNSA